MSETKPVTACCGYHDPTAIFWNEGNGVVQCHNCGHVYVPRADALKSVGPSMPPPSQTVADGSKGMERGR